MTTASPHSVIQTPQIGATSRYQKRAVRLEIVGSTERIRREYGKQEFRPEVVRLAWENTDDSPDWKLTLAEIAGSVWKSDGTPGLVPASRTYTGFGRPISEAPAWLVELVLGYGPFARATVIE